MIINTEREGAIKVRTIPELHSRMLGMIKGQFERYGVDGLPTSIKEIIDNVRWVQEKGELWKTCERTLRDGYDDCEGIAHLLSCSSLVAGLDCLPAISRFSAKTLHAVCQVKSGTFARYVWKGYPVIYPNLPGYDVIDISYFCGMGWPASRIPSVPPGKNVLRNGKIYFAGF